jgi:hypothetical protein
VAKAKSIETPSRVPAAATAIITLQSTTGSFSLLDPTCQT